jgi:hypothetical protein
MGMGSCYIERRMKVAPLLASVAALAVVAFASRDADAYERQWHLGADAGYNLLTGNGLSSNGATFAVNFQYGLNDVFNVYADAGTFVHSGVLLPNASVGLVYVFDILSVVPWAGGTVGAGDIFATSSCSTGCSSAKFILGVPFGIDYQLSRSFALGVHGKYQLFVGGLDFSGISATAHAEFLWGY